MGRAGGWILGLVVVVGMAAAGLVGLRPVLLRKSVTVEFADLIGWTPAQESAIRLAFAESQFRAGSVRVEPAFVGTSKEDPRRLRIRHSGPYWSAVGPLSPPSVPPQLSLSPEAVALGIQTAGWVRRSGIRRVFLGNSGDSEVGFETGAVAAGIECISWEGESMIQAVLDSKPELVILSYPIAPAMVEALRLSGYSGKILFYFQEQPRFSGETAGFMEGVFIVSGFPPVPPEFAAKVPSTSGGPVGTAEYHGYLMAKLVLDAIQQADTDDQAAIYRELARSPEFTATGTSTFPGLLHVVRKGALEVVESWK